MREACLRIIFRLYSDAEDTPMTIEDLANECENFTALKMDNTDMEGTHDIHAAWKKKLDTGADITLLSRRAQKRIGTYPGTLHHTCENRRRNSNGDRWPAYKELKNKYHYGKVTREEEF
ncbi:unnamed protein product [Strongylus vulgaris]|uniref:Peptidase A2 domain-containing protein n=1 Tax=Strongylus vulgaris TaxID=40348 RepID=A0A3P7KWC0_STRVU|nr:unnamed protein product [Strongylus vulgaris]